MKRATRNCVKHSEQTHYFNPRPREEGDRGNLSLICLIFYFNPRPREEGDIIPRKYLRGIFYFNPRPREEGDRL